MINIRKQNKIKVKILRMYFLKNTKIKKNTPKTSKNRYFKYKKGEVIMH